VNLIDGGKKLYAKIEQDFRLFQCTDDWSEIAVNEFITPQFSERYMGLVTDNTDVVNYVYSAVFPSEIVIDKIIADNRCEALLFVHHPMRWDITQVPAFIDIPVDTLKELRRRKISIYNLHVPLDANGTYGTTYNLAKALGVNITDEFCEYGGVNVGIIGDIGCCTTAELKHRFEKAVGHEVSLYPYGGAAIAVSKVALVAGGGNDAAIYPLLRERGINTFITGIAALQESFAPSVEAHAAAKENKINILAGTHYSTEKFACIKVLEYFAGLGIPGEFIADVPCLRDM